MARHVVCAVADLPPGSRRIVEVAGRSIGVFNVDGALYAVRNRCPHQGGPLCEGATVGLVTSDGPGHYRHERPGEIVRCPWHAWEFDLRTGASWFDPVRQRVRAYEVSVIEVLDDGLEPPAPGLVRGPYTAETLPVAVDGPYVVVEVG